MAKIRSEIRKANSGAQVENRWRRDQVLTGKKWKVKFIQVEIAVIA